MTNNNELVRSTEDNPYSILVGAKSVDDLGKIEEYTVKVKKSYFSIFRLLFQHDEKTREAVLSDNRRENILKVTEHLCYPGTKDIYESVIDELLEELDKMKALAPSSYLIDGNTGKALFPINSSMTYTPPDYVDESGIVRKSKTILSPGISSALALFTQEQNKLAKCKPGPAYEHLNNPGSIKELTEIKLKSLGIEVVQECCDLTESMTFEIGHEHYEGVFQSTNPKFHRFVLLSEILAKRICGLNPKKCSVGIPEKKEGGKQIWFDVTIQYRTL